MISRMNLDQIVRQQFDASSPASHVSVGIHLRFLDWLVVILFTRLPWRILGE